jgi:hypothetical protein
MKTVFEAKRYRIFPGSAVEPGCGDTDPAPKAPERADSPVPHVRLPVGGRPSPYTLISRRTDEAVGAGNAGIGGGKMLFRNV